MLRICPILFSVVFICNSIVRFLQGVFHHENIKRFLDKICKKLNYIAAVGIGCEYLSDLTLNNTEPNHFMRGAQNFKKSVFVSRCNDLQLGS